ncbi:MAG: outer membrane protein assembly factor BamB [Burkholderiaceae bacterium]|jgi:outer membrane assembly lipoprotein YfgL|nr:outer membrane protein assembly factor BamB [Burkholderiaceae bacterium]
MNLKRLTHWVPHSIPILRVASAVLAVAAVTLAGCQGTSKPKPAPLESEVNKINVRQAWTIQLPPVQFPVFMHVSGDNVAVTASDGTVAVINASSGTEAWRVNVGAPITAGVGSDGSMVAVITNKNQLVAIQDGKILWKRMLSAEAYTPPLVAGSRIFVQTADRTASAWDGQSGRSLWVQSRSSKNDENLVLARPGVMLAVGDTLVSGIGGRLVGMDPANGGLRWEVPVSSPRGVTEVDQLTDLVGTVSRVGDNVCVRAYAAMIGCVDAARGTLLWNKSAQGYTGLSGDSSVIYGTESNGVVAAWNRDTGEKIWTVDRYKHRDLTAPVNVGRTVIVGEGTGDLYFLSRTDGTSLARLSPDGSPIVSAPVMAANTVVVLTNKGGVFGYRPE